jgi:hypothetical protein
MVASRGDLPTRTVEVRPTIGKRRQPCETHRKRLIRRGERSVAVAGDSHDNPVELPRLGDSLQPVGTPIFEPKTRTGRQVLDRA